MTDRLLVDELKHDSGFTEKQLAPYMREAMDELIDRLLTGKKVGSFGLDAYVESYAEEIAAMLITHNLDDIDLRDFLETRIRAELADSDEVRELAAEFAKEKGECDEG